MSLKFGLNVKAKPEADEPPTRKKRATIFDDDLDAGSDDGDGDNNTQSKGGNVFGEEEELTEFNSSTLKSSLQSSTPKPKPKPKPSNRLRPGVPPPKPPVRKPKPLSADDDGDGMMDYGDLSTLRDTKAVAAKAEELDPTIYDYDAFHNAHSLVHQQKKAAERQDAVERKPRYINNLLDAAARRKQDQQVAREKLLQKERENEGDEFADKEKFVTGAYKQQQEETRRLEEAEKKKADEDEQRRRKNGGGMQGFYKNIMSQEDKRHEEAMEAARKLESGEVPVDGLDATDEQGRSDVDLAAEMRAKGVNVHINDEGQVTDKRQLLSAGLNVAPAVGTKGGSNAHSADHLKSANQKGRENAFSAGGRYERNDVRATRERQTRMLEEQLEQSAKRKREEEEEERKKLEEKSKSRKTESDISSARERYLARKREQEEVKKKAKS